MKLITKTVKHTIPHPIYIALLSFNIISYLAGANLKYMNHLMLSAFYDAVNKNVGPTLMWVLILLMAIELIYVTIKYTGSSDEKK